MERTPTQRARPRSVGSVVAGVIGLVVGLFVLLQVVWDAIDGAPVSGGVVGEVIGSIVSLTFAVLLIGGGVRRLVPRENATGPFGRVNPSVMVVLAPWVLGGSALIGGLINLVGSTGLAYFVAVVLFMAGIVRVLMTGAWRDGDDLIVRGPLRTQRLHLRECHSLIARRTWWTPGDLQVLAVTHGSSMEIVISTFRFSQAGRDQELQRLTEQTGLRLERGSAGNSRKDHV